MIYKQTIVFIGFYLFVGIFSAFGQQISYPDSLNNSLTRNMSDTTKLNTLIKLADYYKSSKITASTAEDYIQKAFRWIDERKLDMPYQLNWIHAEILMLLDRPNDARLEMKKVIAVLEKTTNYRELARAQNQLAKAMEFTGLFLQAIDVYDANIEYAREKELLSIIPQAYLGMGNVYSVLQNPKEEKMHLNLFLKESIKENNLQLTAQAYYRLGYYYSKIENNYLASIQMDLQSVKISKLIEDSVSTVRVSNHLGWNYYKSGNLDSSLYFYLQSIRYKPANNNIGMPNTYESIGTIYRDKKEYKKALHYYGLCEKYCIMTHDIHNRTELYKNLSEMYAAMNDYKNAYQHYILFKSYNDSLTNTVYSRGLADARARYDTENKEKELQLLNLKLDQRIYLIYGFAGFIFILSFLSILFFRQSKLNEKRKMSELNHQISEITHANLRQQMNPHFIFNTLNSIQYYMYRNDKLATNNYLTKFSRLIRKILENSQVSFTSIKDEMEVVQLYLELESLRFKEKFHFEINVDEDLDTLTYKIPTMLIQPYVENAVCHGLINKEESGLLNINIILKVDHILCIIEDNGIGREAALEIKNKKNISHNSLGIKITESRIDISNALYGTQMKANYVDLKDANAMATGTRVELILPIMT